MELPARQRRRHILSSVTVWSGAPNAPVSDTCRLVGLFSKQKGDRPLVQALGAATRVGQSICDVEAVIRGQSHWMRI